MTCRRLRFNMIVHCWKECLNTCLSHFNTTLVTLPWQATHNALQIKGPEQQVDWRKPLPAIFTSTKAALCHHQSFRADPRTASTASLTAQEMQKHLPAHLQPTVHLTGNTCQCCRSSPLQMTGDKQHTLNFNERFDIYRDNY